MAKYILLSVEDARWLAGAVDGCAGTGPQGPWNEDAKRYETRDVVGRLRTDDGGDFESIVAQLKGARACAACAIEGQLAYCANLEMHKIGRRLDRLVERAQPGGRGHRLPLKDEVVADAAPPLRPSK